MFRKRIRWAGGSGLAAALFIITLSFIAGSNTAPARAQSPINTPTPPVPDFGPTPHLGYGISVGPHLIVPPTMLASLGLNWVKIYDLGQAGQFPGQNVLFRLDVRGYPANISQWERDLYNTARSIDRAGVDAVEIGNEPNLRVEWGNQPINPRQYADVLCRAYRVFNQTAPHIVIVSAGLAPTFTNRDGRSLNDLDFVVQMLRAGAGDCFDAFGYHPYGFDAPPEAEPGEDQLNFRRTEIMRQTLEAHGIYGRQFWLTEFGWVRDPAEEGLNCAGDSAFRDFQWMIVNRNTQADYTVRAFQYADEHWQWVGPMFLWNLNWAQYAADYESPCSHLRWYGILRNDGTPLPVYNAIQAMPKNIPEQYLPIAAGAVRELTRTVEQGCAGITDLGNFVAFNAGYPGALTIEIEPANGPGVPLIWTSATRVSAGAIVTVLVDARLAGPGSHLIAINLRSVGQERVTGQVVRGVLTVQPATSPECVARLNGG